MGVPSTELRSQTDLGAQLWLVSSGGAGLTLFLIAF